jgi:hypothetical protein
MVTHSMQRAGAVLGHRHKASHAPYKSYYRDRTAEIDSGLYAADIGAFGYTFNGLKN